MTIHWSWYPTVLKKHYADFNGRARRQEFWTFTLVNLLITIPLFILGQVVSSVFTIALSLYSLAVLVPTIAVGVRRLHDVGKSGWWYLLIVVTFVQFYVLWLLAKNGQSGMNRYGENPKGV